MLLSTERGQRKYRMFLRNLLNKNWKSILHRWIWIEWKLLDHAKLYRNELNGKIECISLAFAAWGMFKNASYEEMRQWQLQSSFHQYSISIHAVPNSIYYIFRITTTWALHFSVLIKPFTVIPISNHHHHHHRLASISNFYASTNLPPIFVQHKINHKYPFADSQLHYTISTPIAVVVAGDNWKLIGECLSIRFNNKQS